MILNSSVDVSTFPSQSLNGQLLSHVFSPFGGNYRMDSGGASYCNVNTANKKIAFSFKVLATDTISHISLYMGRSSATASVSYSLFATNADGVPTGSALATATLAVPANYDELQISSPFGSYSLTPGNYAIVLSNGAAVPSTDYPMPILPDPNSGYDPSLHTYITTDGGTTWGNGCHGSIPIAIRMTNTGCYGLPLCGMSISRTGTGTGSNFGIYNDGTNNRMVGFSHTPTYRRQVRSVRVMPILVGTYATAGNLYARIYDGTTLVAQSLPWKINLDSTLAYVWKEQDIKFSAPVILESGREYTIVICSDGGTSSHYWKIHSPRFNRIMISGTFNPATVLSSGGFVPNEKSYPVESTSGLTPSSWTSSTGQSGGVGNLICLQYVYDPISEFTVESR